jgi:hypothetical protein
MVNCSITANRVLNMVVKMMVRVTGNKECEHEGEKETFKGKKGKRETYRDGAPSL